MPKGTNQKLKLYYLSRIMTEKTDDEQLLSNNHDPYDRQILTCKPIVIKDGAWIGAGATILSGVTIGKFAIVGAASVVTHDVGDYEVAVGSPARVIKTLDKDKFK